MVMIFIYDHDNDPDLQCQDRANRHLSASNQRLHGNHWLALHPVSQKTTLYFGSKCQLIFSTFISNVDIFPHCPHYEGLVAIFRPRVTFINRWWLFDLVLFTSPIMIQDHYFHHLHCTYLLLYAIWDCVIKGAGSLIWFCSYNHHHHEKEPVQCVPK